MTGASKGIEAGIAAALADAGATVAVDHFRDRDGAQAVVDRLREPAAAAARSPPDVAQEADVIRLFAAVPTCACE